MTDPQNILIIGGHGQVALRIAPLLSSKGHNVTSLIRDPEQRPAIEATGASAHIADIRTLNPQQWDELLAEYDTVIWSAGAGGKGGVENTYAVDRDAAIASIRASQRVQTRYVMVSFWGATTREIPQDHPLHHYGLAKKAADEVLLASDLDFVILAPTALHDAPAQGIAVSEVEATARAPKADTSRQLVAEVAAFEALAPTLPNTIVAFHDGDEDVEQALGAR
ncbi:NAD(P)H-binding protein [Corynebacterium pelargi]|uniref:Putative sugar epimerase YhfK n=1 Tax=Corynebacterium pelargi TaxID=1471400 RepID=A0A410W7G2_9CORY|nr:NAD(P)H-binding protein [Corynebacterium pelargi]QAU51913.1 putative sugar epimerase YhfK [Corynebacterium pelargi]GGG71498.1 NAD-dependent dehydratase [Corynebacterium pelargi]